MFLITLIFSLYSYVFFSPEDISMSVSDKRFYRHTLHYFPSVENDASRITWAHAVNSREKLEEALKSDLEEFFFISHSLFSNSQVRCCSLKLIF